MIPLHLAAWAMKHHVSVEALAELRELVAPAAAAAPQASGEAWAQSAIRLEAPTKECRLFRNNVGALEDAEGRQVRFGLANDSPQINKRLKSSDLVGWRRVVITPDMVGKLIAQFLCREVKRPGWNYAGTDREEAQLTWITLVNSEGGDAAFTTGPGSL
jgi:hypothetical protein